MQGKVLVPRFVLFRCYLGISSARRWAKQGTREARRLSASCVKEKAYTHGEDGQMQGRDRNFNRKNVRRSSRGLNMPTIVIWSIDGNAWLASAAQGRSAPPRQLFGNAKPNKPVHPYLTNME